MSEHLTSIQADAARIERRKQGPLYASGRCQMCGYIVPPRALWCSGSCATEYATETSMLAEISEAEKGAP